MWRMHLAGEHLPPLLIILGPTAIGKTGLAIEIAQQLDGEIIGADSRQIYRYMDIGTAKPTAEQRALVPHHLVDFVEPDADYGLADYQRHAYDAIATVTKLGKLPILVGGTGQYITAVEEGWSIPQVEPNEELRAALEAEASQNGRQLLHARLEKVDPAAAEKIHPNDKRRVIRALEVYEETGTPISVLQRKQPPPYRIRTMGLQMGREALYAQADERVDQMIADGFFTEVQSLLQRGFEPTLPAMSALGYRELIGVVHNQYTLDEAIELTKNSTHDFIRRQEIWFRGHDNGILWHNMNDLNRNVIFSEISTWMQE